jgi:hypothetical protein
MPPTVCPLPRGGGGASSIGQNNTALSRQGYAGPPRSSCMHGTTSMHPTLLTEMDEQLQSLRSDQQQRCHLGRTKAARAPVVKQRQQHARQSYLIGPSWTASSHENLGTTAHSAASPASMLTSLVTSAAANKQLTPVRQHRTTAHATRSIPQPHRK